jgi:hypothetical protein
MIIVGTLISSTKVKVDGSFIDGSQTVTISTINPPNPPVNQIGKDTVLYLNPVTGDLFWDYVDRPKTAEEVNTERIASAEDAINAIMMML